MKLLHYTYRKLSLLLFLLMAAWGVLFYYAIIDEVMDETGLSSYLVWVGVKFSNAKEEELLINDASQIGSKKFDFSIE